MMPTKTLKNQRRSTYERHTAEPHGARATKSPEPVHAEAELGGLRDALLRLTWEHEDLKRAATEITALGDDEVANARGIARSVLTRVTATT